MPEENLNRATVIIDGMTQTLLLNAKDFKTGSKGYFASGKLDCGNGKRYQLSVQAVLIGSKPKPEEKK